MFRERNRLKALISLTAVGLFCWRQLVNIPRWIRSVFVWERVGTTVCIVNELGNKKGNLSLIILVVRYAGLSRCSIPCMHAWMKRIVLEKRESERWTVLLWRVSMPYLPALHSCTPCEGGFSPLHDSLSDMKGTNMGYPPLRLHQHEKLWHEILHCGSAH